MPKTIIAGNWKMHKTRAEARTLAQALVDGIKGEHHLPEIVRLIPIICVGESEEEHGAELTDSVIRRQITAALADLSKEQIVPLMIAYEPLWAIGTGKSCPTKEANRVAALIRATINDLFGIEGEIAADNAVAETIPILYGGSVKASTIKEQLNAPEINGVLVGGASLSAVEFLPIIMGGRTPQACFSG